VSPDQKQELDDIAKDLFDYVDNVKIIRYIFDALPTRVSIASPYLNLRDALFHFKKMYIYGNAKNNSGFTKQSACIQEHLNRGLKDFVIHLCSNFYIRVIHNMINSKSVDGKIKQDLRKLYHGFKNLVIDVRLEGQSLRHFDDRKNLWLPRFVDLVKAFKTLLDKDAPLEKLYHRFSKSL